MTEVVLTSTEAHTHTRRAPAYFTAPMASRVPHIEMQPNPDFSFPMLPASAPDPQEPRHMASTNLRPSSAHLTHAAPFESRTSHRRAVSTLPSFSFNADDSSGRVEDITPPRTPDEPVAMSTPSRRGHRRGASEFVGGDSRFGVEEAISTSPTKMIPPMPSPAGLRSGRRGHAHRRSAAISSHDVISLMQPSEATPRLSSSLPNTPAEQDPHKTFADHPEPPGANVQPEMFDPFGPPLEDSDARPPSRPRVGFSDNVEYIPRPLSTISSETEESTLRGHSVNNSISSMLSLGTPSPPSARVLNPSLSTTFEVEPQGKWRSSIELNRKQQAPEDSHSADSVHSEQCASEQGAPSPTISWKSSEASLQAKDARALHRKKRSLSYALGLDRRRSEPVISQVTEEMSQLSAISLPGASLAKRSATNPADRAATERRHSSQRFKEWALGKMTRRGRSAQITTPIQSPTFKPDLDAAHDREQDTTDEVMTMPTDGEEIIEPASDVAPAETDLDMVFGAQGNADVDEARIGIPSHSRVAFNNALAVDSRFRSGPQLDDDDDSSPVLDLDAALGPFKTPAMGLQRHRRELHSSRLTKDFSGPGGHYHRRAESAPVLTPFDSTARASGAILMADVFEEDEEDTPDTKPNSSRRSADEESRVGISVVDSANLSHGDALDWGVDEPMQAQLNARRPTAILDQGTSSLLDETITEEGSLTDAVEIVHPHEEPRSISLAKSSSDSSDAPTVIAAHADGLQQPVQTQYLPSYSGSPQSLNRQASFDTSRLGTSASSIADNRTISSYATGEHGMDQRVSTDDVPSLTSSRSTMTSTAHAANIMSFPRQELVGGRRPRNHLHTDDESDRRRKRSSIQSLSQLVGGSFGPRSKAPDTLTRPQTAVDPSTKKGNKKEPRLKKLMFWKNLSKQSLQSHQA